MLLVYAECVWFDDALFAFPIDFATSANDNVRIGALRVLLEANPALAD